MLANLQQIPFWQWLMIVLVIIGIAGLIVWLRRKRLRVTKMEVTTGPVKTTFEPTQPQEPSPPANQPYAINFSKNKIVGKNKISIRREGTNFSDSTVAGENEIEMGAKPGPKPKGKK